MHTTKSAHGDARYPELRLVFTSHDSCWRSHPLSCMSTDDRCWLVVVVTKYEINDMSPLPRHFLRNEQPSVSRALPPVGWHSTVEQPAQMTTVWACEKTVVMVKQPGHLTSMKKDRGAGTRVCMRSDQYRFNAAGCPLRERDEE